MSRELPDIDIPDIVRQSSEISFWLPRENKKDISGRPLTKILIGLTADKTGFYPLEINIGKKGPKSIFIVGNGSERSKSAKTLRKIVDRQSSRTAPGYLKTNIIESQSNPLGLTEDPVIKAHLEPNLRLFPPVPSSLKVLQKISEDINYKSKVLSFTDKDPKILVIEDLAEFFRMVDPYKDAKLELLIKILNYTGKEPNLTIVRVQEKDLSLLQENGITKESVPGFWLFESKVPGLFHLWNKRRKKFSKVPIFPFD